MKRRFIEYGNEDLISMILKGNVCEWILWLKGETLEGKSDQKFFFADPKTIRRLIRIKYKK